MIEDFKEEEGQGPKDCRLRVSSPWTCEDGYRWISIVCEEHGTTWREGPLNTGTAMRSCTTRASGMTLAGFRVFRSRKELERWLSGVDEEDFDGFDDD